MEHADYLLNNCKYEAAVQAFSELLAADPRDVEARLGRANALMALGKVDEASGDFEECRRLAPDDIRPRMGRAFVLALRNQPLDAADELEDILKSSEDARKQYVRMSDHALALTWNIDSLVYVDTERLIANPNDTGAFTSRADSLATFNDDDENYTAFALLDYTVAVDVDPHNVKLLEYLASGWDRGDENTATLSRSADMWTRILEMFPDHEKARYERASALWGAERCEEALADITVLLRAEPENPDLYAFRGSVLADLKRFESAIADYDRAFELSKSAEITDSARGNWYSYRAECKVALDDTEGAMSDYMAALPLVMGYSKPEVRVAIANLHAEMGDDAAAFHWFEETIKRGRRLDKLPGLFGRADFYLERGELEKAMADAETALKVCPDAAGAFHTRARVYERMGQMGEAQADYGKARELGYWENREDE